MFFIDFSLNNPMSDAAQLAQKQLERAISVYCKNDFKQAIVMLNQVNHPNTELLKNYYLGMSHVQLGQLDEGLSYYKKIRQISREDTDPNLSDQIIYGLYINMGSVLQVLAKKKGPKLWEESIECYKYAQQLNDSDPKVWNNLGNAYLDLHRYTEAETAFLRAIELDNEHSGVHYSLSLVYEYTQDYTKAIDQLKITLDITGNDKIILNRLAGLCLGIGHFEEAREFGQKLVKSFPSDPEGYKNLALILYNMEQYDEAYEKYLEFKNLDPNFKDPEVLSLFRELERKVKKE